MQEVVTGELRGVERASLLLISLGSKMASEVLQHLPAKEVEMICTEIAKRKTVNPDLERIVYHDFVKSKEAGGTASGGIDFAREVLEQSMGGVKADEIMHDIAAKVDQQEFVWLTEKTSRKLAPCLRNERPQVIAMVLAHLPIDWAAKVVSQLPPEIQGDIAFRLTSMLPVDKAGIKVVEGILRSKLSKEGGGGDITAVGGVQSLVNILNNADRNTESKILEHLERVEPELADVVRQHMFVFEDIAKLDNRAIQSIIRELEPEVLRMSVKGASEEMRQLFYRNMSERAADSLREELDLMGPVRRKDIEAAQKRLFAVIRHLDEVGEISIRNKDDEMVE